VAAGKVPDEEILLASPPTPCRLENRIQRKTLIQIASVLVDQFIASQAQPPEHLTLDFDATGG
jgi:DDE family transposase